MPDPIFLAQVFAASAATAAIAVWILSWPWSNPPRLRSSLALLLGMAGALVLACRLLEIRPHWPPREDQDRLLLIVLPLLFAIESVAVWGARPSFVWLLRGLAAIGAAPILLYGSVYIADAAGPGARKWTPYQAVLIFITLGCALFAVWYLLTRLHHRTESRAVPGAVVLNCLGATAAVLLSGYASAANIGIALAAAAAGSILGSAIVKTRPPLDAAIALSVVGLFALLVMGCFFGSLTVGRAAALLFAPLLCWLPELPLVQRLGSAARGALRLTLTAVPLALVLALAYQQFVRDTARFAPSASTEPSLQDYLDFGK